MSVTIYLGEKKKYAPSVVAIGNFDGIHAGHKAILEKAVETAKEMKLVPACLTFEKVAKKEFTCAIMQNEPTKTEALANLGFGRVDYLNFREIYHLTPAEFVDSLLIGKFMAKAVVVGENFRFGVDASGDVTVLKSLLDERGVKLTVLPLAKVDGEVISSSVIRSLIEDEGNIGRAEALLGHPYTYCGSVDDFDGKDTGKLFVPFDFVAPAPGLYAAWAKIGKEAKDYRTLVFSKDRWLHIYIEGADDSVKHAPLTLTYVTKVRDAVAYDSDEERRAVEAKDRAEIASFFPVK